MGEIFARRIIAGTISYNDVAKTIYKAETDEALYKEIEKGTITKKELADLMAR